MHHRTLPALALLGWAFCLFAPTTAAAQNYNPKDGNGVITGVTIDASGLGQLNDQSQQVGTIGVEDCRELMDKDDPQVGFAVDIAEVQSLRRIVEINYNDAYLLEFAAEDGFSGTCDHENDNDCRRLDPEQTDINLTPRPQDQPVQGTRLEVSIAFEKLLEYEDERRESCSFAAPSEAMSGPRIPLQSDGSLSDIDTGTTDAADTGMADTTGAGTDAGGDAGTGVTAEGDRVFAVRSLLTALVQQGRVGGLEEDQRLADAALRLDLTRPPAPSSVLGDATQNKVVVKFDPPSSISDVASYHVFHSTSDFSTPNRPEELEDNDAVERRILSSTSEEDDGTIRGEATGIDRNVGEQLYIAVAARDEAGNFSILGRRGSPVTVKESVSFPYDGSETGGCGCSSASALPTGLLLALLGIGALGLGRTRRE